MVARPRLAARLDRGALAKLTLISAPTGFGKTSLVAQWLTSRTAHDRSVAWLALDPSDDQPTAFWAQMLAALQVATGPAFGEGILPLLESGQPPTEGVLAAVVNELSELANELDLVFDDYHVIEDSGIHDTVTFLLEHLPPQVHVVITTRADPPLPLARLRAQGELVEIRAADLRFSAGEASTYLNEVMGFGLDAEDVAALEERTEGWIAALQLAALSMEGRDDIADFVARFTGNDRYIVDYLVEEVLQRLPDEIRTFLLDTCILDRLSGPLCDAVTAGSDSKAMLGALERRNLFVVPLDDQRRWYRYHHLFADVLQAHLEDEQPERAPELHRRAGDWYEHEGDWTEAIRHTLAARDFDRTAELVEGSLPAMRKARQETALRGWVEALPDDLVRRRPVLSVGFAGALLASGELAGVEGRLDDAERQVTSLTGIEAGSSARAPEFAFVDEGELRRVPGQIEMYRTALAQARGDVGATVEHAQRVLTVATEDDYVARAGAAGFLGIVSWTEGDLETAHRAWSECVSGLRRASHVADALGATIALGDICVARGRLRDALSTYQESLELVPEQSRSLVRGTADMHVGMSEFFLERLDLEEANQHLQKAHDLGEYAGMPQFPYRWRVASARVRAAEGDPEGAQELIDEAERFYVSDFFPNVRPVAALRARLWIANSQLRDALGWARQVGVSVDDDLTYLREFEHITLARLLLARAKADGKGAPVRDALALLERLGQAAAEGARSGSMIEILVLEALALQVRGDTTAALEALARSLAEAEPEGYVHLLIEEGLPMTSLLKVAARHGIAPAYIDELLAAGGGFTHAVPKKQGLIEPLSERELDVLRLLRSDLSGPDIARELMVSLNTMRTHTKNIYTKLDVNNRRAVTAL
jgi:LuxR family maltose regulon positive regulatory protein